MREARPLVNAAGEIELDRLPARANLAEALAVYALALFALWGLVGMGLARGSVLFQGIGHGLLAVCLGHALLLAPWLHGDRPSAWGLSRPGSLARHYRGLDAAGRRRLRRVLMSLLLLLAVAGARGWPNLLARLGVRRHFPAAFEALAGGAEAPLLGALAGALALFPLALLLIRWDNFLASLRALLPLMALLALGALALGVGFATLSRDWSRLAPAHWLGVHPDRTSAAFYLIWGFGQQILCLGYFNGRLRRGIGPRGLGPLSGRALAALATGALFGGLHLPSWPLVGLTFVTGSALAWYFQVDRTRNLFVLGLVHGMAGTLLSRVLPLSLDVGPWPD